MPGDRPGLAVSTELADARAKQEQSGERSDRACEVNDGRTGEVHHRLAANVGEQAAAVDAVCDQRVDDRAEDRGIDHVRAELDPLERRAPDDRQRDRAEEHPEQHQSCLGAPDGYSGDVLPVVEEEAFGSEDLVPGQG